MAVHHSSIISSFIKISTLPMYFIKSQTHSDLLWPYRIRCKRDSGRLDRCLFFMFPVVHTHNLIFLLQARESQTAIQCVRLSGAKLLLNRGKASCSLMGRICFLKKKKLLKSRQERVGLPRYAKPNKSDNPHIYKITFQKPIAE